jgi:hypothetical protein
MYLTKLGVCLGSANRILGEYLQSPTADAVKINFRRAQSAPDFFSFLLIILYVTPKKEGEDCLSFAVRLPFAQHQDDY